MLSPSDHLDRASCCERAYPARIVCYRTGTCTIKRSSQRYANCLMTRSLAHMVPPKVCTRAASNILALTCCMTPEKARRTARGGGHGYVHTAPIAARDTHLPDRGRPLRGVIAATRANGPRRSSQIGEASWSDTISAGRFARSKTFVKVWNLRGPDAHDARY
jgi:hypothetical protein